MSRSVCRGSYRRTSHNWAILRYRRGSHAELAHLLMSIIREIIINNCFYMHKRVHVEIETAIYGSTIVCAANHEQESRSRDLCLS
jgi:hypothetical protein